MKENDWAHSFQLYLPSRVGQVVVNKEPQATGLYTDSHSLVATCSVASAAQPLQSSTSNCPNDKRLRASHREAA